MIQKRTKHKPLCYFCQQVVEEDSSTEHHPNFPKRSYPHLLHITVWCHLSCQQTFHRSYQKNCQDNDDRDCGACLLEWAILCLYHTSRVSEIRQSELTEILLERKWLAERKIILSEYANATE